MERLKSLDQSKKLLIGFGALIIVIYLIGVVYHNNHFLPKTNAGAVSVSGQTVESATERINESLNTYPIALTEDSEAFGYIELGQVEAQFVDNQVLHEALREQNQWAWPIAYFGNQHININSSVDVDDGLVAGLIDALGINNSERTASTNAYLQETETGMNVISETYGNQITVESLESGLVDTFNQDTANLELNSAYEKPSVLEDSQAIQDQMSHIDAMRNTKITMAFDGNEVSIPQEFLNTWVYVDEEGNPQVDITAIEDYILEVNREYSQLFKPHTFNSTYQGQVEIDPGTLGWYIDRFTESENIASLIHQTGEYYYEPYIEGYGYGMNGMIGNTYVEVDLATQMMLIYQEGELVLETPIVSGKIGANTIPGAYQVWQKLEDTDLTGYDPTRDRDYVQPVDYWIAFDDQLQGIHDAEWQSYFGGDAHLYSGSLGCINTPPSVMSTVFEIVQIGYPVIVF